jgi:hypothetical protein
VLLATLSFEEIADRCERLGATRLDRAMFARPRSKWVTRPSAPAETVPLGGPSNADAIANLTEAELELYPRQVADEMRGAGERLRRSGRGYMVAMHEVPEAVGFSRREQWALAKARERRRRREALKEVVPRAGRGPGSRT